MGMFDEIQYKANCKECGAELENFQSKDGDCVLAVMSPEELVDSIAEDNVAFFYDLCDCGLMNNYRITKNEPYTIEEA